MKFYFTIIAALMLTGTAVEARLGEGEERMLDPEVVDHERLLKKGGNKPKVTICHKDGKGRYRKITVSQNAVQAHLNHGDCIKGDSDCSC
jgi:hypothetical protein